MDKLYKPVEHERRSRQIADSLRNLLIGVNTGGIAVALAIAGKLMDPPRSLSPRWIELPLLAFALGLTFVAISMMFAKSRELTRRNKSFEMNVERGKVAESPATPFYLGSALWDGLALVASLSGFWLVGLLAPIPR